MAVGKYIQQTAVILNSEDDPTGVTAPVLEKVIACPQCGLDMVIRRANDKLFLSCVGFPHCKCSLWFPNKVLDAKASSQTCSTVISFFCFYT